jgi:transcriptional regulator with XRE-family HTH domain
MELHKKIKQLRKKKELSQQEFADKIGLHISYVSRLENGHSQPSIDVLKKLTKLFEVTADYLLNGNVDSYDIKIKNKNLAEKIRLIDELDADEQQALNKVIDSMLTNHKMRDFLNQKTETLVSK